MKEIRLSMVFMAGSRAKLFCFLFLQIITISSILANDGFLNCLTNDNSSKQKTLVILYRPDCPYCRQMNQVISSEKAFQQELTAGFRIYAIDINSKEGRLLANQLDIRAVPTIINFNNGTGDHNIIKGFGGIEQMRKRLGLVQKQVPLIFPSEGKKAISLFAACGNGIIEAGEQCDDGNLVNGDGCSASCTIQAGYQCVGSPSVCTPLSFCGNGVIEAGEQCDDGNSVNGDGCSASCTIQAGYQCVGSPSVCTLVASCGNGVIEAGEQCDDGNSVNGDGCSASCTIQAGYQCVGSPSVCTPISFCGNGVVDAGEQCDDGNSVNGDGCSASCTIQAGYQCTGSPSVCTQLAVCGDGILQAGETCDDGNLINGDGCSSACTLENGTAGVLIKNGTGTADYSAMLDINSTKRGILIPRMTTLQRNAISGPATGLMVFDNTSNSFWYYGGTAWKEIRSDVSNASFSAFVPASAQNTAPGNTIFVSFPSEEFDDGGNNYNPSTGLYTVPASGVYEFSATVSINLNSAPAASTSYTMTVYESAGFTSHAVGTTTLLVPASYIGNINLSASGTVKLTAGTGGTVKVSLSASTNAFPQPIIAGKFSGHRVY